MDGKSFGDISIRGRVAYMIMCFEKYATIKYPDTDWKRVSDLMWSVCDGSDFIDIAAYKYMEIIPELLYRYDDYESSVFENLSENDYNYFTGIIPKYDEDLDNIMHSVYAVAIAYAYGVVKENAPVTFEYIDDALNALANNNIEAPDINLVKKYVFDKSDGYGPAFDGRYLSIILN